MAINYTTDVLPFFDSNVVTDAAYQIPGTFGLPVGFGDSPAEQRLLSFIEIFRSYLNEIDNVHEAKLLSIITARMVAAMKFGTSPWNNATMSADAQKDALQYLHDHVLAKDL